MRQKYSVGVLLVWALSGGCTEASPLGSSEERARELAEADALDESHADSSDIRMWQQRADNPRCRSFQLDEDYSTGLFNVHRFITNVYDDDPLIVSYRRTGGSFEPAIIVMDQESRLIFDGFRPIGESDVWATVVAPEAAGDAVEIELRAPQQTQVAIFLTSHEILNAQFDASLPRDSTYRFTVDHLCAPGQATTSGGAYAGIERDGVPIPRAGLANGTLRRTLGISVEPLGELVTYQDREFVAGTTSWFGSPNDRWVGASETGAITGERLRSLNSPVNASRSEIDQRPDDFYYCAMRWDYGPRGAAFFRGVRLLVINPVSGQAVVVRAVDWGPNTRANRLIDLSPQALDDLGAQTDDEVYVAFAPEDAPLGVVQDPLAARR